MVHLPAIAYWLTFAIGVIITVTTIALGARSDPSTRETFRADLEKIGLPPSEKPEKVRPQRSSIGMTLFMLLFCLTLTGWALKAHTSANFPLAFMMALGFWGLSPCALVPLFDMKNGWTIDGPEGLLINNWRNQLICFRYDELTSYRAVYKSCVTSWTNTDERTCYVTWIDKKTGKEHSRDFDLLSYYYGNLFDHLAKGEFRGQFYTDKDRQLPYKQRLENSTLNYHKLTEGFASYKNDPAPELVALVPPNPA